MNRLAEKSCIPCRKDSPPLPPVERQRLTLELRNWALIDDHHLQREFLFKDFLGPLALVNRIAAVAETEGHHPDIYLGWGKVRVLIWSHVINNLTLSDFILAAKIDRLFTEDGVSGSDSVSQK